MNIPLSSDLPDAVQKVIGRPGSAGTVKEAIVGILVTVSVVWVFFKSLIWIRKHKS